MVGCGLLTALVSVLDLRAIAGAFTKANPADLLAGLTLFLGIRILHARQLAVAVRTQGLSLGLFRAFTVNAIAVFYGFFFPGGFLGGAVKWYKLSKGNSRPVEVLGAILFLRLVNMGFSLACGLAAAIADAPFGLGNVWWVVLVFAAGFTALYGLLSTEASVWLEGRPLRLRSTAATLAYSGLRSVLRALRHYRALPPRAAFAILSVPVLSQMLGALVYFLTARALGQHVPVLSWVWILSLVQILQWVPASVSGLGLREGALVLLLPRYGVPPADALVFSIVVFGYTVVIGLLGGVFEARELIWKAAKEDVKPAGIRR